MQFMLLHASRRAVRLFAVITVIAVYFFSFHIVSPERGFKEEELDQDIYCRRAAVVKFGVGCKRC